MDLLFLTALEGPFIGAVGVVLITALPDRAKRLQRLRAKNHEIEKLQAFIKACQTEAEEPRDYVIGFRDEHTECADLWLNAQIREAKRKIRTLKRERFWAALLLLKPPSRAKEVRRFALSEVQA